ncbi:MAG TPA: phosphoribosyltransferase [Candidatus Acidoferrum sp.]|nr:phosphoribosyltransferase [Candidatus Acidoferrum sp.]
MKTFTFPDRNEAGRALARQLSSYADRNDVVVLALPRGGVPIGFEIAHALRAPLDIFLVRKLGVPMQEELAMGAIASGGTMVLNESLVEQLRITREQIDQVRAHETRELERREQAFRPRHTMVPVIDRICILVDDGLATGSTMHAAVLALKKQNPAKVVVAVPVASRDVCEEFQALTDEVVCLYTPEPFMSVGQWYDDFTQLTDEDVRDHLERAAHQMVHEF